MPTAALDHPVLADSSRRVSFRAQFVAMALRVQGRDFGNWPGWSTGETLIVALILNRTDVLQSMRFTMIEAIERCDLFTLDELLSIAREVNS